MPATSNDRAENAAGGGVFGGCWWLRPFSEPRDQVDRPDLMLMPWQTFPAGKLYAGFASIACVGAAGLHFALLRCPCSSTISRLLVRAAPTLDKYAASAVSEAVSAIAHVAALAAGTPLLAAAPCAAWFVALIYRHCRARSLAFFPRLSSGRSDCTRFLRFRDPRTQNRFSGKRIPIEDMYEMYFDGKLDFLGACILKDVLSRRHEFVRYTFSLTRHLPFLLFRWIPDVLGHSKRSDTAQVRDHYDRGTVEVDPFSGDDAEDDFFGMFLGRTMVYTAGIATRLNGSETLEQMQRNKLALVCSKLRMQPGDRHLDIGCGWGTLVQYAASVHGAFSTGVTLSRNQTKFAAARAKGMGLDRKAKYLCMDYRDIPGPAQGARRYDKISCLEMAEHVGVKNFHSFLGQVREALTDDGIFFLQIAGLRRPFQYEDLVWGLFMAKYIFPGADASMPLGWVVGQLERAGFEVAQVDNVGVHYSLTIHKWYQNWVANKERVTQRYGQRWFRIFEFFLAWSSYIASSGAATCYQITCHKNVNRFDRTSLQVPAPCAVAAAASSGAPHSSEQADASSAAAPPWA